jgi:hypothetical protein
MTESDILSRDIDALTAEQQTAWRELSSPALTAFDRREIRNRIRQGQVALRNCLKMQAERLRFRTPPAEAAAGGPVNFDFRLF